MAAIRLWVALVVVVSVMLPTNAFCDSEAQQQAKAKARRKKAATYYEAGKFDLAVGEFLAAYKMTQQAEILFNIGQVYEVKGEPARALDYFLKYLGNDPTGKLSEPARTKVVELAQECLPESLRAKYKEAQARRSAASEAEKPALEEKWTAFYGRLAGGEKDGIDTDLAALAQKPKVVIDTTVQPEPEPVIVARRQRHHAMAPLPPYARKWWFWTAIGGGAAVVLVIGLGAGLGGQASDPHASIGVLK